jgi:large subunit ribosomal protein L13
MSRGAIAHKTTRSFSRAEIPVRWWVVDARDQVLGRLATRVAMVLRGKHRATYTPHADTGDFVIVVNAAKVRLTGRKAEQKLYRRHSGYTGHLKETTAAKILAGPYADRVVREAVRGMLPKNALGRKLLAKLKVHAGPQHPHAAQKPEELPLA